ncbi:Pleckstrin homology domain-containing family M member 3-like protein, partial [Drosera capensis]
MEIGEGLGFESLEPLQIGLQIDDSQPFDTHRIEDLDVSSPVSLSPRYSSCGESEFERYCSANSATGTSSLCSLIGGFQDCVESSDFGSVKSFGGGSVGFESGLCLSGKLLLGGSGNWDRDEGKLGSKKDEDDHTSMGLETGALPSLDDVVEYSELEGECSEGGVGDRMSELSDMVGEWQKGVDGVYELNRVNGHSSNGEVGFRVTDENVPESIDDAGNMDHGFCDVYRNGSHFTDMNTQLMVGGSGGLVFETMQQVDAVGNERCRREDEVSSTYEHSEGEEPMFNYDSDDKNKPDSYHVRNMHDRNGDYGVETENGNPMLMNASVAFGSKDWEDFELDTEENGPASDMFAEFQESLGQMSRAEMNYGDISSSSSVNHILFHDKQQEKGSSDVSEVDNKIHGSDKLSESLTSSPTTLLNPLQSKDLAGDWSNISILSRGFHGDIETEEYLQGCDVYDIFVKQDILSQPPVQDMSLSSVTMDGIPSSANQASVSNVIVGSNGASVSEKKKVQSFEENESKPVSLISELNSKSISTNSNLAKEGDKGTRSDVNQFYDEFVNEMEEILFDSTEALVGQSSQDDFTLHSPQESLLRDGGPTASTSGIPDGHPLVDQHLEIDGIEVVGARQKKGDISLSERLVGVKEHTVYVIRVRVGKDRWEVERRYRDFYTLYRELKSAFAQNGLMLPHPWFSVEQESKKIFGNVSPDVIAQRSILIQECLRSILQHKLSSGLPSSLIWFLSPTKDLPDPPNVWMGRSMETVDTERLSTLGKTIPLIVELQPYKSIKQMLEIQHYTCAGCRRNFHGTSKMQELVQTFGWGKPRLCEYMEQLFCSSCHTNGMAVLPARVLHNWDFNEYPVSQLANSYLDSVIDQPVLCVSAVNSFLFSKVPTLFHVVGIRKKIGAMLPYVHCPFRSTIYRGLRSRRYLLESNDFFALRDLIDLSKGAFAALPVILDTVLKKIEEHITEQCLVCCDAGIPCGARQACDDPSSLIFPFQEEQAIQRCEPCKSVFHKHCFERLLACPCGAHLKDDDKPRSMMKLSPRAGGVRLSKRKESNTIVLAGLNGSGKTVLFYQKGKLNPVHIVDVPGHSRLRPKLDDYLPQSAGLVFVVDALEFLSTSRAAA